MELLAGPLGVALVGVLGIVVGGLLRLIPGKGTIENTRIDQLQDDLEAERKERKALALEVNEIRSEQHRLARRDLAWILHYDLIKQGVEAGTIPPWPELPVILGGTYE